MENLEFALKASGTGILFLLLALVALAGIISLMTKYLVDKPEKEEDDEETVEIPAEIIKEDAPESKKDLKLAAAIALAIYRSQVEMSAVRPVETGAEVNSWRQFNLINRLNQSSNIRRPK
jgi:Na+-transporting methylmalonyl-CoA/oxaloacetate decarboxylase gamma subunit